MINTVEILKMSNILNYSMQATLELDIIFIKRLYFPFGEELWELILHTVHTTLKGNGRTASSNAQVQREGKRLSGGEGQRAEKS